MLGILITKEPFFRVRLPLGLLAVSSTMYAAVIGYIFTSDDAKEMAYYLSHAPILLSVSALAAFWSLVWGQMPINYLRRKSMPKGIDSAEAADQQGTPNSKLIALKEWMVITGIVLSFGAILCTLCVGSDVVIGMARSYKTDNPENSASLPGGSISITACHTAG